MIIQCEQCRTKFKLDDEKVTERGVKVRCAKCRHVFTVRRPETDVPPPPTDQPAAVPSDETVVMSAAMATSLTPPPSVAAEPEVPFDFGAQPESAGDATFDIGQTDAASAGESGFNFGEISFADVSTDDVAPAPSFDDKTVVMAPPKAAAASGGIDFGTVLPQAAESGPAPEISFDFGEARPATAPAQAISFDFTSKPSVVAAAPAGDVDFGGFDFGDVSVAKPDDGFSLGGDDFGSLSAAAPQQATSGDDLGFSFGDAAPQAATSPGDSFDFSGLDLGPAAAATAAPAAPAADSFSLGEFDFGTEATNVAVPASTDDKDNVLFSFGQTQAPVTPAAAHAALDNLDLSPAAAVAQQPAQEFTFEPAAQPEEAPPLSIASRRRQSPLVSALIAVTCLVAVGALAFVGYLFLGDGDKAANLLGKTPSADAGKIIVQKVQATFLTKTTSGDLLIITGEAQNNFSKPRAALQVKGTVFGPANEPLLSQTAYAGNQLTREQLASMPKEKILAAMNNQFGDSLANLEVQPGKTIPFTLVIINPPANGKDFGVEAVGSTVAASK